MSENKVLAAAELILERVGTRSKWVEELLIEFAKLHVQTALETTPESRCIKMFDQTWYAQSLIPGTTIIGKIDITIDKDSIINDYPLNLIK